MINFESIQTPALLIVKKGYTLSIIGHSAYIRLMGSLHGYNRTLLLLNPTQDKTNTSNSRSYICFFNGKIKKFSIYSSENDIFSLVG